MKTISALGVVLGGAMIFGCASGTPRANTPSDVFEAAREQLAHSLVGTTTLTSAPIATTARDATPLMPTYEVYAPAAPAARTWGAATPEEDDDLAPNPYRETRDIYDPR